MGLIPTKNLHTLKAAQHLAQIFLPHTHLPANLIALRVASSQALKHLELLIVLNLPQAN